MSSHLQDETCRVSGAVAQALAHVIKARARHYARRPLALESLYPGLSRATPQAFMAITDHLVEGACTRPARRLGFGGETTLVNAHAARLLGRLMRRTARAFGTRP